MARRSRSWPVTAGPHVVGVDQALHGPDDQQPGSTWYHDHALGITRLNVYAGLAGFYLVRQGDAEAGPLRGRE